MSPLKQLQEADAAAARAVAALTECEAAPELPQKAEAMTRACSELYQAINKVKAAARAYRRQTYAPVSDGSMN